MVVALVIEAALSLRFTMDTAAAKRVCSFHFITHLQFGCGVSYLLMIVDFIAKNLHRTVAKEMIRREPADALHTAFLTTDAAMASGRFVYLRIRAH